MRDFEVIVVDNSGRGLEMPGVRIISNEANVGFGAAVNQAIRASTSAYVATLNDDAVADPRWLESLASTMNERYEIGMCASRVVLAGAGRLDSAGMFISAAGRRKQWG